jgi:hypothetical protein
VDEGHFEMSPVSELKKYPVGIVGEASYQATIRRCSPGESVEIVHELHNPYDEFALAVVAETGSTIGYIARDCWLREAIHEEGRGCNATIKSINSGGSRTLGVVLDVVVQGHGVPSIDFRRPKPDAERANAKGLLARLLGF